MRGITIKEMMDIICNNRTYEGMFKAVCASPKVVAAEYFEDGEIKQITYKQQQDMVETAAKNLYAILDTKISGKFIGLKVDNSPKWPVLFWGILMAGYRPLLIDSRGTDAQTLHVMKQAGANIIITDLKNDLPSEVTVVHPGELETPAQIKPMPPVWGDAAALCTSGTTATSKVYVYDGEAMARQMLMAGPINKANNMLAHDKEIKQLAFLPFHHIFGLVAVLMWFSCMGKTMVYLRDRAPSTIMETCRRHDVTHIFAVPIFWNNVATGIVRKLEQQDEKTQKKFKTIMQLSLTQQKLFGKAGRAITADVFFKKVKKNLLGDKIQFCISGGGHVQPHALRMLNALGYHLAVGFGMTEVGITGVEMSNNAGELIKSGVGMPFEGVRYDVLPLDKSNLDVGELVIMGDSLHSGRMIDGEFVARNRKEWFHSGDIVRRQGNRYWIEGRLKEVIINESGENVYPDELEDSFAQLPGAEQICAMGLKSEGMYEDIALVVELKEGAGDKEIAEVCEQIKRVNGTLPLYKQIRKVYLTEKPLPLANGIKVQRQKLKASMEQGEWPVLLLDVDKGKIKDVRKKAVQAAANEQAEKIKTQLQKLFAEALGVSPENVKYDQHFINDLGGDSLSSIGVFTKAEEIYGITIMDSEYFNCATVNDFAELVLSKLSGTPSTIEKIVEGKQRIARFEQSPEYKEFMARREQIADLEKMGNPFFVEHDSALKDTSIVDGKRVINFGSYNYLGLSGRTETIRAAQAAAAKYGVSASGSRLLAGEKPLYKELEREIAKWKHTEDAMVLVGGHSTNVTFVGNFCNKKDLIIYDAICHNSIVQGCQLSQSESKAFPHNDYAALENMLKAIRDNYEKVLIIVEGVYSMDGDIAPIPEFVRLKKEHGCFLMVDEAHSSCVIGEHGGGVDEYFLLEPNDIDIKMGTLSKGLGACGGYLAGSGNLIEYLRYNCPGFVFSVGISPPLAAATLEALKLMQRDHSMVQRLHKNIDLFISEAKKLGFDTCLAKESAIIPILIGGDAEAYWLSIELLKKGIFVPPAVYPAVPRGQSRLRFCVNSEHKKQQIEHGLKVLKELVQQSGIIK